MNYPMNFKPVDEFPLLNRYKEVFPGINDKTIFAYGDTIYTNVKLDWPLIVHETTHLRQQEKIGLDEWVSQYLSDPKFRLEMEKEAYKKQLDSVKDRNVKARLRMICAHDLSGPLYNNIISLQEALKILQ